MATQSLQTTNFTINFDPVLKPNSPKRAQALFQVCESEFSALTSWFGVSGGFGSGNRIIVNLTLPDGGGGNNQGYRSDGATAINVDAQDATTNDVNAADIVRMIFMAEFSEVLMDYRNTLGPATWNRGDSDGEGLSQLCALLRFKHGHNLYYGTPWVDTWLQLPDRDSGAHDWISNPKSTDADPESFGCALLFLFYLKDQLGHSVPEIIQKGGSTLAITYQNLTGKTSARADFLALLDPYFPVGKTQALASNNPFPLLSAGQRTVDIDPLFTPNGSPLLLRTGTAVVSPFLPFLCPAKRYGFKIYDTTQSLACVATTHGAAQPVYAWRVNGVDVPAAGGAISPLATVSSDDPNAPGGKTVTTKPVTIIAALTNDAFTSTLALSFPGVLSHIDLVIEALAHEKYVSPSVVTTGIAWVTVDNEKLVWDEPYYKDRAACTAHWNRLVHDYVRFNPFFNILKTLPDPPPDFGRVLRQLGQISVGIRTLAQREPEVARQMEEALVHSLGINAALLREIGDLGARYGGASQE